MPDHNQDTKPIVGIASVTTQSAPVITSESAQKVTPDTPVTVKSIAQPQIVTLDHLINLCIEKEASDIHFGGGDRVALRVQGKIAFVDNLAVLPEEKVQSIVFEMLSDAAEQKRLERIREIDFSYTHKNGVNFRVNAFYQQGLLSAVMRMISKQVMTLEELNVPIAVRQLLSLRKGLILITGTAGSGKSTTIQAIIEYINQNSVEHIITIENPIEYIFEDKNSIITQREVGKDTLTIPNALKSAVREDPNIIMVSEIKDLETLDQIMTVVETGNLVFATMPTGNATQTLERMITMYPQIQQQQAEQRIATNLLAILSQDLVDKTNQSGRVAVYELLINTPGIQNLIKRANLGQIRTAMQSSTEEGMITMDVFAYQLAQQGVISEESASRFAQKGE
jgi:twitching motility protein PilT